MKVTKEQMKSYKSTLTQEQGEAQLREDLMHQKRKRREKATYVVERVIAIGYIILAIYYIINVL